MSVTSILGQVPTILGSLTTIFTPPPACTVAVGQTDGGLLGLGLLGGGAVGNFAFLGQTCSRGQPADDTACWPPITTGAPARGGVYSPGIECPAGYATACSATAGGSTGWPMQFSLGDRETAVGCCPSGFGCANINGQTCTMLATSTVVPTVTCDGNKFGALAFNTVDPAASVTAFSLFAPMIQINFQSSDLSSSSSSSVQPSTAPGVVPVPVPTSGTASTQSASSPGVSTVPIGTTTSSSTFQTSVTATTSTSTTEPQSTTTSLQQPDPPIESNTSDTDNPSIPTPTPTPSPSSSPAADLQPPDNRATTFPQTAAVGIGVGGGVAVLLAGGSALIYLLRRRRLRREDEELDRLYGLGKLDTNTGQSMTGELPGFYRGQRPADLTGGRQLNLNF